MDALISTQSEDSMNEKEFPDTMPEQLELILRDPETREEFILVRGKRRTFSSGKKGYNFTGKMELNDERFQVGANVVRIGS